MNDVQYRLTAFACGVCILMATDSFAANMGSRLSQFAQRDADVLTTPGRVQRAQKANARDMLTTRLAAQLVATTEQGIEDRKRELRRIELQRTIQRQIRDTKSPELTKTGMTLPTTLAAKEVQQTVSAVSRQEAARQVLSDYRTASASAYTHSATSRLHNNTTAAALARTTSSNNGRGSQPDVGTDPRQGGVQGVGQRPSPRRHPNLPENKGRDDGTPASDNARASAERPTVSRPGDSRASGASSTTDADTRPSDATTTSRTSTSLR